MAQTLVGLIVSALWLVCVIVCFLKWKMWTAIFGIIAPVISNIPIGGMYLHHIITEPFIYVALPAAAIRLAKPVSWWAKWFYWGPMGSDRRLLRPSPKLARAMARFPEQTVDFEKPGPKSSNSATQETDTSAPPSNVTTNESPQKEEHLVATMRRTLCGIRDFVNHNLTLRRRTAMNDNVHYDQVAKELQAKEIAPGVWAKAFAKAGGELERARALYIKYRVAQLLEEANEKARHERRAAAEALKQDREYARKTRTEYTPPPPPRSAPPPPRPSVPPPASSKTASSADTPTPSPVPQRLIRIRPYATGVMIGVIVIGLLVGVLLKIQSDRQRLRLETERQQVISDDGKSRVTVPGSWKKLPDLNEKKAAVRLEHDVAIYVGDDISETYLIVITYAKTEVPNRLGSRMTLEEHHQLTRDQRLEEMNNASATSPTFRRIDGHPALQDEITGTRKDTDFAFLHTTIDDGIHFQQILGSTVKSRWQQQEQLLREITATFRSEK